MIAHLEAIAAKIRAVLGDRTPKIVIGDATGLALPYIVLQSGVGNRDRDLVRAGSLGNFEAYVDVVCAAAASRVAIDFATQATDALTPGFDPAELSGVPGRYVVISHLDSRPVEVDRTVTLTGTNQHPAWALTRFIIRSKPTGVARDHQDLA